jgi:hypothetical protein
LTGLTAFVAGSQASAAIFGGVEFPAGAVSFADVVVSYQPLFGGGPAPTNPNYLDPTKALGIPDYSDPIGSVSLGDGGRITLQFTDNLLTGSNSAALDLWIFEIGPDIEDTFVDISKDGVIWSAVGKVTGSTAGIDIDSFGFGIADQFSFVRLTDDTNLDDQTGSTVGADIDAVGAISTIPTSVIPEPSTWLIFTLGAASLVASRCLRRRFRQATQSLERA